jgi:hypothetical protein
MERAADDAQITGHDLRLRRLQRNFDLDPLDVEVLLIALIPDIDPRFEQLYGYLVALRPGLRCTCAGYRRHPQRPGRGSGQIRHSSPGD